MIKKTISLNNEKRNENIEISIDDKIFKGKTVSSDLELINKSTKRLRKSSILPINKNDYIIEHYYKNEDGEACLKINSFNGILDKVEEINVFKGVFNNLSKKELKVTNILNINEKEVKENFKRIINGMNVSKSFKSLLIKQTETYDDVIHKNLNIKEAKFIDLVPYLYFDEKLNKKVWVIPNGYDKEDIILDYETEIPIFLEGFVNYLSNDNRKFIVIRNENIESFFFNKNNCYSYLIDKFPEGFLLNDIKQKYNNIDFNNLFNINTIDNDEVYLPELSIFDIENTIKISNMVGYNREIDDIKNQIEKYLNVNYNFKDILFLNKVDYGKKQKEENNIFITNKYDFISDKKTATKLNNLNIVKKYKFIPNINMYEEKIEINFLNFINLDETLLNNPKLSSNKKNYILKKDSGIDFILPKNKELYLDEEKNNLKKVCNIDDYTIFENNFLIVKDKNGIKNYDLKENIEINGGIIHLGKDSDYYLIHNENNNNLILLNKKTKEFKIIDKTKKCYEIKNIFKSKLDFNSSFRNFKVLITDNKMFYFEDFYNNSLNNEIIEDSEEFKYEEFNKNEKNNYTFKTKVPLLKKEKSLIFSEKSRSYDKFFSIKNNKLDLKIYKKGLPEINDKYLIADIEYEFEPDFIELNDIKNTKKYNLTDYVHSIKINDIKLIKEEAKDFLNQVTNFEFKNKENIKNIDAINKKDISNKKILISKNNNDNFNLYIYPNNNMINSELLKLHKNSKIKGKKIIDRLEKTMYFSENKLFILEKNMNDIKSYDFSLKKTLEYDKSFLNIGEDGKKIIFCNNSEILEIQINEETKKIEKVINISEVKNNKKIIAQMGLSI